LGTTYREYATQHAGADARQERTGIRFTAFESFRYFSRLQPDTRRDPPTYRSLSALSDERFVFIQLLALY
jgi:hypothetical protein